MADEPVSMLDVSVRAGVLNLLQKLSDELNLTTLYISHDLSLIRYMCDTTAVMYLGQICEIGPTDRVITRPRHPYTKALISSVPVPDPDVRTKALEISRTVPTPINLPPGCRFRGRCPFVMKRCRQEVPPEYDFGGGHRARCYLHEDGEIEIPMC